MKNRIKYIYYSNFIDGVRRRIHPFIMKHKFDSKLINESENFLRLHLGCGNIHFPGYINIDFRKTDATDYVCNAIKLPLVSSSVEVIEIYHMIEHLPKEVLLKALRNWWDKLTPGGRLVIECPDFDKIVEEYLEGNENRLNNIFGLSRFRGDNHLWGYNFSRLRIILEENGFKGVKKCAPQDYHRLQEPCMRVEAYKSLHEKDLPSPNQEWLKRKQIRPETLTVEWRENHIHARILSELKKELFEGKTTISMGCGTGNLEVILGKGGCSVVGIDISDKALQTAKRHKEYENLDNIHFIKSHIDEVPFLEDSFNAGYAIEVIEHIEPDKLENLFLEIKRVLKPDSKFLITLPNKNAYLDTGHRQFFTKSSLAELFDKLNISFNWIELEEREDKYRKHNMLKALLTNEPAFKITKQKKICAIGGYESFGYNQLGFHWDGQARAFRELGFETLFLDIRKDQDYENIKTKILDFKPDILWLGLIDCLSLL